MAFINLKKLSFKTCLKTYGSYVKQSNCKFICYFKQLISYDFSCIIDGELFAGCLLSYIFHLVFGLRRWKAELRSRWCYTICRGFAFPSHSSVRWHLKCFSGRHLGAVSPAGVTGDGAITWCGALGIWGPRLPKVYFCLGNHLLGLWIPGPCPAGEIFSSFLSNPLPAIALWWLIVLVTPAMDLWSIICTQEDIYSATVE